MVKMAHAEELPQVPQSVACTTDAKECPGGSYVSHAGPDCEFAACPGETSEFMPGTAPDDVEESSIDEMFAEMEADEFADDELTEGDLSADIAAGGESFIDDQGKFLASRKNHLQENIADEEKMMQEGAAHQEFIEAQPALWWENWQDKIDPEKK